MIKSIGLEGMKGYEIIVEADVRKQLGPTRCWENLLADGLGIEAIQKGFQVYFVTMGELIHLLKTEGFTHKSQIN